MTEILQPGQFPSQHSDGEFGTSGYHATQRYIRAKDGRAYRLQADIGNRIDVHPVGTKNDTGRIPVNNAVARLTWFGGKPTYDGSNVDGGVIYKAVTTPRYRRKGLMTGALEFARDLNPEKDIRHSDALTEDGAAWAAATPTEHDLRRRGGA